LVPSWIETGPMQSLNTLLTIFSTQQVTGLMSSRDTAGMAGALLCYVGLFLYLPVMFGSFAVAYRRIFPELAPPDAPNA